MSSHVLDLVRRVKEIVQDWNRDELCHCEADSECDVCDETRRPPQYP